jgi:type I restriction enzyme S subunit
LHDRVITHTKEKITNAGVLNSNVKAVTSGTVLMSFKLSLGRMAFAGTEIYTNEAIAAFTSRGAINEQYLFYVLPEAVRTAATDVAIKGATLNKRSLAALLIPHPAVHTQMAIARVLSSIDTAIEKTEALIAKHQQIKAGLMHDLFTRGVLPNGQLRPPRSEAPELYQETAVGWIPSDWSMSDCAREFAIDSGITLGPHRRPVKNARPYLRVANVHRDELRLEDVAYLEVLAGDADIPLKEKDLLIVEGHANRMEIGRCAMVTGNAIGMLFQNHLFRLRPHRLVSEFALYWLNSHHAQGYWDMACSTSSGLNTINRKMLGRLPVAVSAPDEQDRILRAISITKGRIGGEKRLLDNLHRQKLGLMQDLLTGKVPVSMNPETAQATA